MRSGFERFWRWRLDQVQNDRTDSTPDYAELVEALLFCLKQCAIARRKEQSFDKLRMVGIGIIASARSHTPLPMSKRWSPIFSPTSAAKE